MPQSSPQTIEQLIASRAASNPATAALRASGNTELSYQALLGSLSKIEQLLASQSIAHHQRVAVFIPQGLLMSVTTLGVMANYTCVPLNTQTTQQELRQQLQELEVSAVIVDETAPSEMLDLFEAQGVVVLRIDQAVLLDASNSDASNLDILGQGQLSGQAGADDIALILQTSGSTARPKKVALTQRQLMLSADNLCRSLELDNDDVCLNMMPPFHVGAVVDLMLAPLLAGGSVVITEAATPGEFINACETSHPTWFQAVPTMLQAIMDSLDAQRLSACESLRFIRSVSSALPRQLAGQVGESFGVPVVEIYGMSEAAGLISSPPLDRIKPGSVGIAAGAEIAICDSEGKPVNNGDTGEIFIRGANVIDHYDGVDAANDENFAAGWLRTGDLGYLDADGYLYLNGRKKELINRGGEKIAPLEIDHLISDAPGVKEAAAFAMPHKTLGEDVALALVVDDTGDFNERALQQHLMDVLPMYKQPRQFYYLDQLPRNPGGKLKRHEIHQAVQDALAQAEQKHSLPASEREKDIARYWRKTLGVEAVYLEDNFFDRGGDSLKAVTMMTDLEKHFDLSLPPSILMDAPRFDDFCRQLTSLLEAGQSSPAARGEKILPDNLEDLLRKLIDTWDGKRLSADALVVGLNTQGKQQPLFWCAHGYEQVSELAALLGDDQPLYGMRSLNTIVRREKRDYTLLARRYLKDILAIQSQGPYMLGGFCGGGMVAFAMANQLRELGHEVNLLILYDVFPQVRYDGRLLLFYSNNETVSPYGIFNDPELGISKLFRGDLSVYRYDWQHSDEDFLAHLGTFAADVQYEISCLKHHQVSSRTVKSPLTSPLPDEYFARKIVAKVPRLVRASDSIEVPVRICNCSSSDWAPTEESGVTLSSRWVGTSNNVRKQRAGHVRFDETLPAQDEKHISLRISTPDKPGLRSLEIDLLEEGVDWLGSRNKVAFRQWVWVKGS